jgi:hypothetical protein
MIDMEKITVNGELVFELESKREWLRKVPQILPVKTRFTETLIWVDKNGDIFEIGKDFTVAEEKQTYPCKVYRLQNVAHV